MLGKILIGLGVVAIIAMLTIGLLGECRPIDGDVNRDGVLNAADLAMMQRHMLGTYELSREAVRRADYNKNRRIDQVDIDFWRDVILGE